MGLWAKLAGGAAVVGGAMTGNPALIAAGAGIIGNDITAEGANKAAGQLEDAATAARTDANARYDATAARQGQVYDQNRAAFDPFISLGQGVTPTLGSMVGLSLPAPRTLQELGTPGPVSAAPAPVQTGPTASQRPQAPIASSYAEGKREPRSLEALGRGLLLVASPDGSEKRWLTRREADRAIAAGGVEVG
jgi:hypothetical protein